MLPRVSLALAAGVLAAGSFALVGCSPSPQSGDADSTATTTAAPTAIAGAART